MIVGGWTVLSGPWGLFLVLCSQLTSGVLGGPYVVIGIEPGSAVCKTSALTPVLYLKPIIVCDSDVVIIKRMSLFLGDHTDNVKSSMSATFR